MRLLTTAMLLLVTVLEVFLVLPTVRDVQAEQRAADQRRREDEATARAASERLRLVHAEMLRQAEVVNKRLKEVGNAAP